MLGLSQVCSDPDGNSYLYFLGIVSDLDHAIKVAEKITAEIQADNFERHECLVAMKSNGEHIWWRQEQELKRGKLPLKTVVVEDHIGEFTIDSECLPYVECDHDRVTYCVHQVKDYRGET
jgi:hypothetical protein